MMKTPDECQPCEQFKEDPTDPLGGLYNKHQCPLCEGWRFFCHNCFTDHHQGGWQSCNHNPKGGPRTCPRNHPACLAAMLVLFCALPASAETYEWVPRANKVVGLLRAHKYLGLIHTYKWVYKLEGTKEVMVKRKPIDDVPDLRSDRIRHPYLTTGKDVLLILAQVYQVVK